MRSVKANKALAIILVMLTLISTGVAAAPASAAQTAARETIAEKTTMEQVKELLEAQSYYDYLSLKTAQGWKDASGGSVTVKAAENYTFAAEADYTGPEPEVIQDEEYGAVLYMPEEGRTSWKINVPQTGFYVVKMTYKPYKDPSKGENEEDINTSNITREFMVDGKVPYKEAYYLQLTRRFTDKYDTSALREDGTQGFTLDKNGNEKKPAEKPQEYKWSEYYIRDSIGYILDPLKFALTEGEHTISLNATMNEIVIYDIVIEPYAGLKTYEEYLAEHGDKDASADANVPKIQAETPSAMSDLTIYALNDRTSSITEPQDAAKQLLNVIGDSKWENLGQWIEWTIPADQITESGYYYIVPRFKQSILEGLYVSRGIYINGEMPFENCRRLQFNYDDDWQCKPLNDGEQDLKFWFEAGKEYTIKMEVSYGNMAETLRRVEACISRMNEVYNSILRITGPSPDEFTSYGFAEIAFESVVEPLQDMEVEIGGIIEQFKQILGGKSASEIATLEKIEDLLHKMGHKESEIAKNLENLKVNTGYLGTWLMNTKLQALTLDFITLQPAAKSSKDYPDGPAGFMNSLGFEVKSFFASFFTDYNSLGSLDDSDTTQPVEVWIATSREEAQVMRELVDNTCPVKVKLKLVAGGTLLPATLAGDGPDISLAMAQTDVINYAIRSAVEPLYAEADGENNIMSDFLTVCEERFTDQALVGLRLEDSENPGKYKYYGMPERLGFTMLFYRKDIFAQLDLEVPKTWDDLYAIVPTLQINYRKVGFPGSLVGLQMLMYQNNEELYTNIAGVTDENGNSVLDGMRVNLDSRQSLLCFEELCTMFQMYKFPRVYDLATYFRMGEMPIAVTDYLSYNQFSIYATELRGLWEFTTLPGTIQYNEDGTVKIGDDGNPVINNSSPCSISATVLMRDKNGRTPEHIANCWEYMKWWTSAKTQSTYAKQYEAIIGMAAKYNTANKEALRNMSWSNDERKNLEAQMESLKGTPEFPGGYIITRYVDFAFLNCYNNNADPTESMLDQIQYINNELSRKRKEFKLITYEEFKEQNEEDHPEWFDQK